MRNLKMRLGSSKKKHSGCSSFSKVGCLIQDDLQWKKIQWDPCFLGGSKLPGKQPAMLISINLKPPKFPAVQLP